MAKPQNPARSILDEKPISIPIAGHIRTGIKVLTKAAAGNPKAVALFEAGLKVGDGYDTIEKRIEAETKIGRSLTPRNTPYFRASKVDFQAAPEIPDMLMKLYGEDRGHGGLQIYRFPVVFAFDDWLQNLPHGLRCFGSSGIKFWSEYDGVGQRYCMTLQTPEAPNPQAKRGRTFGGRLKALRADNGGACNPEKCGEYQNRQCTLSGRLLVYIPGIPGSSLISIDTTSIYSLQQIRAQMELLGGLRQGRISGTLNGQPLFYMTKLAKEVSRLGDDGKPTKTKQFLVNLEANISMVDMMGAAEMRARALSAPQERAALAGPAVGEEVGEESDVIDVDEPVTTKGPVAPPAAPDPRPEPESGRAFSPEVRAARADVFKLVQAKGKDPQAFSEAMAKMYGEDWSSDLKKLGSAKFVLESE